ncbi:hypothetical protein BDQ12DRAFT_61718 [Crucibulum laeve]|uniref:GATA-type domain-containing protein n=1 Tax=Crucibulum laeve TaxID=68775 RepID=A0A5C3M2I0_9AGAR|nr:hypothetical protein BDQ12DRAFT_61718 [Crucibulum laeve]
MPAVVLESPSAINIHTSPLALGGAHMQFNAPSAPNGVDQPQQQQPNGNATANGNANANPNGEEFSFTSGVISPARTPCVNCNTLETPLWRRDPDGNPICNACGEYTVPFELSVIFFVHLYLGELATRGGRVSCSLLLLIVLGGWLHAGVGRCWLSPSFQPCRSTSSFASLGSPSRRLAPSCVSPSFHYIMASKHVLGLSQNHNLRDGTCWDCGLPPRRVFREAFALDPLQLRGRRDPFDL